MCGLREHDRDGTHSKGGQRDAGKCGLGSEVHNHDASGSRVSLRNQVSASRLDCKVRRIEAATSIAVLYVRVPNQYTGLPGVSSRTSRGRQLKHMAAVPKHMATKATRLRAKNYKVIERTRASACRRGYDRRWESLRRAFLQSHPVCVHCLADGRVVPAREVDHIVPHRGDETKFWDRDNWQALCKRCHSKKTAGGA